MRSASQTAWEAAISTTADTSLWAAAKDTQGHADEIVYQLLLNEQPVHGATSSSSAHRYVRRDHCGSPEVLMHGQAQLAQKSRGRSHCECFSASAEATNGCTRSTLASTDPTLHVCYGVNSSASKEQSIEIGADTNRDNMDAPAADAPADAAHTAATPRVGASDDCVHSRVELNRERSTHAAVTSAVAGLPVHGSRLREPRTTSGANGDSGGVGGVAVSVGSAPKSAVPIELASAEECATLALQLQQLQPLWPAWPSGIT
eukprot:2993893-Pleurochrysis_carterae.AAC.13